MMRGDQMVDDVAFKPPIEYDPSLDTPKEQRKEFQLTWLEFAAKNREQRAFSAGVSRSATGSTSSIMFTVPKNNLFLITNVQLNGSNSKAATGDASVFISTSRIVLANLNFNPALTGYNAADVNFNMPIVVFGGEEIKITVELILSTGATTISGQAVVQGFLEPVPT